MLARVHKGEIEMAILQFMNYRCHLHNFRARAHDHADLHRINLNNVWLTSDRSKMGVFVDLADVSVYPFDSALNAIFYLYVWRVSENFGCFFN